METPEHIQRLKFAYVRQQAMDAVAHRETTAAIRAFQDSGIEAAPLEFHQVKIETEPYQPITDEIRQKAMDAVSHPETMAAVRLVADTDHLTPDHTPSVKNTLIAERIAEMHKTEMSIGAIQQTITKDNFGRENEIG
jgi:hypothetical protein